eukprot:gene9320-10303_t
MSQQNQPEHAFLFPETFNDTSLYSTPRSSICEGVSTDCEADVESNLSANSEYASPNRRRSSAGIYGIVKANEFSSRNVYNQRTKNQRQDGDNDKQGFFNWRNWWKIVSSTEKLAILSAIVILVLIILAFVFLFPSFRIGNNGNTSSGKDVGNDKAVISYWPVELRNASPTTKMVLADVDLDGEKEILFGVTQWQEDVSRAERDIKRRNGKETASFHSSDSSNSNSSRNRSLIIAIDADSGEVVREVHVNFQPYWIKCDPADYVNASCFGVSRNGTIAKLNMAAGVLVWATNSWSDIHSVSLIEDIDMDGMLDMIVICSWQPSASSEDQRIISGIALVSGRSGNVIGSKTRYQLSQLPSPFLMQHVDAKNNTCILFATRRSEESTIWAVRLRRLVEIATGARKRVNLVSENPLLVVRNARTTITPVHYDVTNDGVKDIGFVLKDGLVSFVDGAAFKLRKTIDAGQGKIISISILPTKNFRRPLLAVFKRAYGKCEGALLSIYNFRNSFDPYTIMIPETPVLMTEMDPAKKKLFVMLLKPKPVMCDKSEKEAKQRRRITPKQSTNLQSRLAESISNLESDAGMRFEEDLQRITNDRDEDGKGDIDIDAIDKDVLENLREYIGINDMGVTRYHKLFHLVCNYLLLRFLISYGITTESVLKDFKATRSHLLNLSNKKLGHVLTDQLKGLLANDYSKDSDFIPLLDDLDNDIEWLKGVKVKQSTRRKRHRSGSSIKQRNGNESEATRMNRVILRLSNASVNHTVKKNCPHSADVFRLLEINDVNYYWKNITGETGIRKNQSKTDRDSNCFADAKVDVKDILIHRQRLYYLSTHVPDARYHVATKLSWLKLNY